jgi:hypothetical protein
MDPELLKKFSIDFNSVRVVIPESLQQKVRRELHIGYCGITRVKAFAEFLVLEGNRS